MNLKRLNFAGIILVMSLSLAAQSPRSRTTPQLPAATPSTKTNSPADQPSPVQPAELAPTTLAVVNDVTISTADIEDQVNATILRDPDPYLRAYYLDPAKETKEARQRALDARINSLLIAAEAKKRGKSSDEIVETEINSRIPAPTDQEIKAAYDANRDQIGSASFESVRPDLINYIRNQRSQQMYSALISRLKMTNVINKNADVNTANLAYAARKQVLDRRINDLLIVAESNKRKVGPEEIVRVEITDKIKTPTEAEVSRFYEENKANIKTDLAGARTSIVNYLQQQQQEKLEVALAEKLRAGAKLQILLKEPNPPLLNVNIANGGSRGDPNAAVTIIEFTDFQCSACGGMYPVVEDVLKSYGNRVRLVIRNFPLSRVHPNAFHAAQAAEAAKAQGKFWEYIDFLFKNQNSLDGDSLKKFATQVGLDRKRFDAELEAGKYDSIIRGDMQDGEMYGVEATPTFFINGAILTEYSADGLRAAIEKAFARAEKRTP